MAEKGPNKKVTTALIVIAGIVICALVFWPESESSSTKKPTSGTSKFVERAPESNISDSQTAVQSETEPDLPQDGPLPQPQDYQMQSRDEMAAEQKELLRRVEETVDSAIMYPNLRGEITPRAERMLVNAMAKYESPFFHAVYADLLFVNREFDRAVKEYGLAYDRMGKIPDFRANYAKAAHASAVLNTGNGRTSEAIQLFETVRQLQPDYPKIDTSLFMCYSQDAYTLLQADEMQQALGSIEKGLQIDSNRFAMNFYAGMAYSSKAVNQPERAVVYLERCKRLNPNHVDTRQLLYEAYKAMGQIDKAKRVLIK